MLITDDVLVGKPTTIDELFKQAQEDIAQGRVIVFEGDEWASLTPEQLKAVADEQRKSWK